MKVSEIVENIVRFPSEKRGYKEDPVTGLWNRVPENPQPEFMIVSGPDWGGKGYSIHPTYKEAELAIKKMKLQGNKEDLRIVEV